MPADDVCDPCTPQGREGINPLLVVIFCPHCFFTGVFAAAASGAITLPAVMGVGLEWLLPPLVIVGGFLTWLWWGRRATRRSPKDASAKGTGARPQVSGRP